MEKNNKQHFEDTWIKIRQRFSGGLGDIGRGLIGIAKGSYEIGKGVIKEIDMLALGLGAIAILSIGGIAAAPVVAIFSKEKNIFDVEKEVAMFAADPKAARLFGYPFLFIGGAYSYRLLTEK